MTYCACAIRFLATGFFAKMRVPLALVVLLWSAANGVVDGRCPCMPRATRITATSAVLQWKDPHSAKVVDYKVNCRGVCYYVTAYGLPVTKEDNITHFVPNGVDHVLLSNLQPNFNYSCTIVAEFFFAPTKTRTSRLFYFSTHYAAPRPPQAPTIQRNGPLTEVKLYPTSTEHGPISGYEVQFHVLDSSLPPSIPQQKLLTPSELLASLETAQKSSHPLSFRMPIDGKSPTSILVGQDLLHQALKNGSMYCVVTVSYTNAPEAEDHSDTVLYSASQPSTPFTAFGHVRMLRSQHGSTRTSRTVATVITTGAVVPVIVIMYISCIGVFILCREQQRIKSSSAEPRIDVIPLCDSTSALLGYSGPVESLAWEEPHTHSDPKTTAFEFSVKPEQRELLAVPPKQQEFNNFAATGRECKVSFDNQSKHEGHSLVLQADSLPFSSQVTSLPILTSVSSQTATMQLVGSDRRVCSTGTHSQSDSQTPKQTFEHIQPDLLTCSTDLSHYETEEYYSAPNVHEWLESTNKTQEQNGAIPPTPPTPPTPITGNHHEEELAPGNSTVTGGRDLRSQISSNVFLPRGLSRGFLHTHSGSLPGPSNQTGVRELLQFDSGTGDQTDHAPELEMDLFELVTDL